MRSRSTGWLAPPGLRCAPPRVATSRRHVGPLGGGDGQSQVGNRVCRWRSVSRGCASSAPSGQRTRPEREWEHVAYHGLAHAFGVRCAPWLHPGGPLGRSETIAAGQGLRLVRIGGGGVWCSSTELAAEPATSVVRRSVCFRRMTAGGRCHLPGRARVHRLCLAGCGYDKVRTLVLLLHP